MSATAALDLIVELGGEAAAGLEGIAGTISGLGGMAAVGGIAIGGALAAGLGSAVGLAGEAQQSVADLSAQFGLTREEAQGLGDIATEVFGDNWGGSISEVSQAVGVLEQQLGTVGTVTDASLKQATAGAFALRDSFGVEIPEASSAATTLMSQFGLTSQEAFDFLSKGFQSGLDRSGDFLDTINEYSTQFANGGADAGQFFSTLQTGLAGGMLGTDKAADLFKEFRVRIQDGSTATSEGLKLLGIDSADLAAKMATGQITAAQAFELVQGKMAGVTDQNVLMQAGVALMGGQFEDLGTKAATGIDMSRTSLESLSGATDSLNAKYAGFPALFSGLGRSIQADVLLPIGEGVLSLANDAMPTVQTAIGAVGTGIQAVSGFAAEMGAQWQGAGEASSSFSEQVMIFVGGLGEQLAPILSDLAAKAAAWVQEAIPPLLANLAAWYQGAVGFIMANVPGWVATLAQLGLKLIAWVAAALPGLIDSLGRVMSSMLNWVLANLPTWAENLGKLAGKLAGFALEALPGLLTNLGTVAGKILAWVLQTAIEVVPQLVVLAGKFLAWVATDVLPKLPGVLATIATALYGFITGFIGELGPKVSAIGAAIIDGIKGGISRGVGALVDAVRNAAQQALDAAKSLLGINSPSKVFAAEVGKQIPAGIAAGILGNAGLVEGALSSLSAGAVARGAYGAQALAQAPSKPGKSITIQVDARGSNLSSGQIRAEVQAALKLTSGRADTRIRTR